MILDEKLMKELEKLENETYNLCKKNNVSKLQLENYLKELEKRRFNILKQIKIYNANNEILGDNIISISDSYSAVYEDKILKIYIPEIMPSYKNLKTHAYKNILLNIAEKTKVYDGLFGDKVCLYIKIFDTIEGWDIDNKFIKPISDALISSGVIKDDNIENMFYCVKGYYDFNNPHTEVYVTEQKNFQKML